MDADELRIELGGIRHDVLCAETLLQDRREADAWARIAQARSRLARLESPPSPETDEPTTPTE